MKAQAGKPADTATAPRRGAAQTPQTRMHRTGLLALQTSAAESPRLTPTRVLQAMASNAAGDMPSAAGASGNGNLPTGLRKGVEALSGQSMADVRVHYRSGQPEQLQALAFAQGPDIHLAPGQERHLPHEAWHVAQQKQGRVSATRQLKAGVPLNDDQTLEREADVMGARAAAWTGTPTKHPDTTRPMHSTVVQRVQPGSMGHAKNSCYAAALINTFAVIPALRNLLLPSVGAGSAVATLKSLLLRAVDTVGTSHDVPQSWMQLVMQALQANRIITHSLGTEDANDVLSGVIALLQRTTPGGAPLHYSGRIVWFPDQTIPDAVKASFDQRDDIAGLPKVIHINRVNGNMSPAPGSFSLDYGTGSEVYSLKSAIVHSTEFMEGHFISYMNRGNAHADEWWRSDDLNPAAERFRKGVLGDAAPMEEERSGQPEEKGFSKAAELTDPDDPSTLPLASMYVYESSAASLENPVGAQYQAVGPETSADLQALRAVYDAQVQQYIQKLIADQPDIGEDIDIHALIAATGLQIDTSKLDPQPIILPRLTATPKNLAETRRQVGLQLEGLARMTKRQWLMNVIINRLKDPESLSGGRVATGASEVLSGRITKYLEKDDDLARSVLQEIYNRVVAERDNASPDDAEMRAHCGEIIHMIRAAAQQKHGVMLYTATQGLLDKLRDLTNIGSTSGIGRRHGEGDEDTFKRVFSHGKDAIDAKTEGTLNAVLHNPDQVAGGDFHIFHDAKEEAQLRQAQAAIAEKAERLRSAQSDLDKLSSPDYLPASMAAPPPMTKSGAITDFFRRRPTTLDQGTLNDIAAKRQVAEQKVLLLKRDIAAAEAAYFRLFLRHYGDYDVNSNLGLMWIEELQYGLTQSNRVNIMLDAVLAARRSDPDGWADTPMSVQLDVVPDNRKKDHSKRVRSAKGLRDLKKKVDKKALHRRPKRSKPSTKRKQTQNDKLIKRKRLAPTSKQRRLDVYVKQQAGLLPQRGDASRRMRQQDEAARDMALDDSAEDHIDDFDIDSDDSDDMN